MPIMEGLWLNTCQHCHSLEKMGSVVYLHGLCISLATYHISYFTVLFKSGFPLNDHHAHSKKQMTTAHMVYTWS